MHLQFIFEAQWSDAGQALGSYIAASAWLQGSEKIVNERQRQIQKTREGKHIIMFNKGYAEQIKLQ